jgi:N6-adenosine-specific RNA methylase IME4
VRQVIIAPPGRHSEKPQQIHEGLERLYADVRRLELFARRERPGWTPWGNEVVTGGGREAGGWGFSTRTEAAS